MTTAVLVVVVTTAVVSVLSYEDVATKNYFVI